MDNNTNVAGTSMEGSTQTTQSEAVNTDSNTNHAEETVTMSKVDFDKAIQAAEVALEQRLTDLERNEKENEAKTKVLNLKASLQTHNIDADIADYLNLDVDAGAFSAAIENIIAARLAAGGYKPTGHQTNQPVTKSEYDKMTYDEKAELYRRDPESWKRLKN